MAKLIMMCGCPGSGKSTFIQQNINTETQKWISRDVIRFALVKENESYFSKETLVFNCFVEEIKKYLKQGYDVYADATHLTQASRNKLLRRIPKNLYDRLEIIYIKVDISVAVYQNELRKNTRAYVPEENLRKMYYRFSEPSLEYETFDAIYIVEPNHPIRRYVRNE